MMGYAIALLVCDSNINFNNYCCWRTQFPELEKIESEYHEIVLERLNFVVQRRQQDDLDDLCLFADVPQGQYSFRHYH